MIFHLVIDAMRRKWLMGAIALFQLYIYFNMLGKIWPSTEGVGWTMSGALFLSIMAGDLFQSRVHYQLPVSRRQWWLARWWLCMTAPVVLAQLAVVWTEWSERSKLLTVEQHILFVTFGVLYCGCGLAVQSTGFGKAGEAPFTLGSAGWAFLGVLGMTAAPWTIGQFLPHSLAELNAAWIVVMAIMAAFTVVGYRYTPALAARPHRQLTRRVPTVPSVPLPVSLKPRKWSDRLTGLKLVVWEECRGQFLIFTFVIVLALSFWAIASQVRPLPALARWLRLAGALPFSSTAPEISEPIVFGAIMVFGGVSDKWSSRLRSLRALPVSSSRLAALPVLLGLVSAAMLVLTLLVLHLLVLRTPPVSARLDLFVAFAAFMAMSHTIRFVGPGDMRMRGMLSFAPVAAVWLGLGFADSLKMSVVQSVMAASGPVLLLASWAVMRYAIAHRSQIYRPRPNPVIPESA